MVVESVEASAGAALVVSVVVVESVEAVESTGGAWATQPNAATPF